MISIKNRNNRLDKSGIFNKSIFLSCYKDIMSIIKEEKIVKPYIVEIFPSSFCNCNCIGCNSNKLISENSQFIKWDTFNRLILELVNMNVKGIEFSGGGEPLLHPNIDKMFNEVKAKGLDICLLTNGCLLNDALIKNIVDNVNIIRISFNATNKESYSSFYGVNMFDEVEKNIINLVENRNLTCSKLNIGLKFLISQLNLNEIENAIKFSISHGVDYIQFKMLRNSTFEIKDDNIVKNIENFLQEMINQYSNKIDIIYSLEKTYLKSRCYVHQLHPVIRSDGKVLLCSYFQHKYFLGDLNINSFLDIWFGYDHQNIVKIKDLGPCDLSDCPYHNVNNMLTNDAINNRINVGKG